MADTNARSPRTPYDRRPAKIRPMPGWVAVGKLSALDLTPSGLHLPREQWNDEQSWQRGEVLSIGRQVKSVQTGNVVLIPWSRHRKLSPTVRLVKETNIIGVFE